MCYKSDCKMKYFDKIFILNNKLKIFNSTVIQTARKYSKQQTIINLNPDSADIYQTFSYTLAQIFNLCPQTRANNKNLDDFNIFVIYLNCQLERSQFAKLPLLCIT